MIVAMIVFWGALGWVIVTLVRHLVPPAGSLSAPLSRPPSDALRILDERLAAQRDRRG
jgi:hypothetical protein